MKITFPAFIPLPSSRIRDEEVEVLVTADVLPSDKGGPHSPPSGPIPEILEVVVERTTGRYESGDDVIMLLGEEDIIALEETAIDVWIEGEYDEPDQDSPGAGLEEEGQ